MGRKLSDLTVEELYAKEKITPSVEKLLQQRDDFNTLNNRYCTKVCKYCHKQIEPTQVTLPDNSKVKGGGRGDAEVSLVIVQDSWSPPDKYKTSNSVDTLIRNIISHTITEIDRDFAVSGDFTLLSSLKCIPVVIDEKIKDGDIKRCSPYLKSELLRLKPKAILCLGTSSSKVLGCNKSVYTNRGEIVNSIYGPVVHTLHPKSLIMLRQNSSGQMWGPDYYSCFKTDLEKAIRIAKGIVTPEFDLAGAITRYRYNNIEICDSLRQVEVAVQKIMALPETTIISFDTETTGLDPFALDAKLLCIQFGWMEANTPKAVVIPLWHRENLTVNPDRAWELVSTILLSNKIKVAHNGKFDIKYIFVTKQLRVHNVVYDTMLLLHELNSGIQGNYSLKKAAWDYLYETGIAGYEDLLPSLTLDKDLELEEDESTTDAET
jgi:hypothetical protein